MHILCLTLKSRLQAAKPLTFFLLLPGMSGVWSLRSLICQVRSGSSRSHWLFQEQGAPCQELHDTEKKNKQGPGFVRQMEKAAPPDHFLNRENKNLCTELRHPKPILSSKKQYKKGICNSQLLHLQYRTL